MKKRLLALALAFTVVWSAGCPKNDNPQGGSGPPGNGGGDPGTVVIPPLPNPGQIPQTTPPITPPVIPTGGKGKTVIQRPAPPPPP
jgi:hypothetical protein